MRTYPAFQEPSLVARSTQFVTTHGEQVADEERLDDLIDVLQLDNSLESRARIARDGVRAVTQEAARYLCLFFLKAHTIEVPGVALQPGPFAAATQTQFSDSREGS